jgi:hypothetical protein
VGSKKRFTDARASPGKGQLVSTYMHMLHSRGTISLAQASRLSWFGYHNRLINSGFRFGTSQFSQTVSEDRLFPKLGIPQL